MKTRKMYIHTISIGLMLAACTIAKGDMIASWDFESGVTDVWTNNLGGTAVNGA